MSVTNYSPEKCRYAIDKLVNAVYLVSENAVKDIRIDNGAAYVNSISETPIKLECYGLTLSEEESLDERYKFIHTLKFSVNGYANKDDFQGRYYVIVRDYEGTWWLVNPLFPCKVAYTYTLGYQQNHTEFNIGTASNHPVLKLNGMSDTSSYQCNEYWLSGIDKLWLNEKKYSVHSGSSIKYTNDGFKEVEYNKSSAVFTESFDGENTSHQIDFDVLFSDYKSSWHYNLLEFKDNLYAAIIKTTDGKYVLCGFSFGLQPGYTVSADDTVTTGNKIQITLQDAHDTGDAIEMFDNISPIPVSSTTWEYTSEHDGYECVGDGVAKYLLQKEIDALGNETGNYKALEGYENSFPGLNIVGTFDSVVTFAKSECLIEPCRLSTSIPDRILFTEVGSKMYTLRAGSNWSITHDQGITVSPESGNANTDYIVTVYNPHTPTSEAWVTNLKVTYCSGQEYNSVITVTVDDSCFGNGSRYDISANAQTLTIPTNCCVQKVTEKSSVGTVNNIYSTYLTVYVPENNSGIARTIILLVEFCDGSAANITINQSNTFENWVSQGTFCDGSDKYDRQRLYTGTTNSSYVATSTYRNVFVEANSLECKSSPDWNYEKWEVVPGDYFCDDGTKYAKERRYVSDDNVRWTATDIYRKSTTVLEVNSTDCGYDPSISGNCSEYRDEGDTICDGYTKYKYLRKYVRDCQDCSDCNTTWQATGIYKIDTTQVVDAFSIDCGFVCNNCLTRWSTVEYTCIGYDKYRIDVLQLSTNDGVSWITSQQTRQVLEETCSNECGCVDPSFETKYLTLIPLEDCTFRFTWDYSSNPSPSYVAGQIYYSLDSGNTWNLLLNGVSTPTIPAGQEIMWKKNISTNGATGHFWLSSGRFNAEGNVMSVIYGDNFVGQTTIGYTNALNGLFNGCSGLTSIDNLVLPATVLTQGCYQQMFAGCAITRIPDGFLNATTLAIACYNSMFQHCTSLTTVPSDLLPAALLSYSCYHSMFAGCTNLTTAPDLLAPTSVLSCYAWMFNGCTNLNYIKCLTHIGSDNDIMNWVRDVQTVSGTFIKDTSATWQTATNDNNYAGIPQNWSVQNA